MAYLLDFSRCCFHAFLPVTSFARNRGAKFWKKFRIFQNRGYRGPYLLTIDFSPIPREATDYRMNESWRDGFALHSEVEGSLLPGNEQSCRASLVRRDRLDHAARCDEGRLQIKFFRRPVPSASQFFRSAHCLSARSCSKASAHNRPFRFGQSHCGSGCLAERLTTARGKMFVIRHASRDETRCRVQ